MRVRDAEHPAWPRVAESGLVRAARSAAPTGDAIGRTPRCTCRSRWSDRGRGSADPTRVCSTRQRGAVNRLHPNVAIGTPVGTRLHGSIRSYTLTTTKSGMNGVPSTMVGSSPPSIVVERRPRHRIGRRRLAPAVAPTPSRRVYRQPGSTMVVVCRSARRARPFGGCVRRSGLEHERHRRRRALRRGERRCRSGRDRPRGRRDRRAARDAEHHDARERDPTQRGAHQRPHGFFTWMLSVDA